MGDATLPLLLLQLSATVAGLVYIARLPQPVSGSPLPPLSVLVISAAVAALVFLISEPQFMFNDFRKAYYPAGHAVLEGPGGLVPLIDSINFVNLPVVAYLFAPLGLVSFRWAALAFLLLGMAATLWAWVLLVREAKLAPRQQWLLFFLFAASGPLIYSLKEGNTSHFVLLGLVAALFFLKERKDGLAGAILGVCALIKLPLLIFGAYFVLRRKWQAVAGFSGVLAGAGLLSILIFGWELNQRWFELCVVQFGRNPMGAFNVQSIAGFLVRLDGGAEVLRDWSAVDIAPLQRLIGTGLVVAMGLAAIAVCAKKPDLSSEARREDWLNLEYALVVVLAVVSSPMSWSHYYLWLLIPIAFFLREGSPIATSERARWLAWGAIIAVSQAIVLVPVANPLLAAVYAKLVVSSILFGGLVWYGLVLAARGKLGPEGAQAKVLGQAY